MLKYIPILSGVAYPYYVFKNKGIVIRKLISKLNNCAEVIKLRTYPTHTLLFEIPKHKSAMDLLNNIEKLVNRFRRAKPKVRLELERLPLSAKKPKKHVYTRENGQ